VRAGIVEACHRLAAAGLLIGTAGNVSARDGETLWVTASGAVLADLSEDDVVEATDPRATSEVALHAGIHEAYDAGAVVHTHAPVSTAASTVLAELPVIHYQQLLLGGAIRVAPYATFGTPELADHVRAALEGRSAALMANHGSVALGATLEQAVENALLLEWLCAVHRDALSFGTPRSLTDQQQEDVVLAAIARSYGGNR
jgi:L-fuculose-phosphate aldolase